MKKTIALNKNINFSGELVDSDYYSLSDYIPVSPNTTILYQLGIQVISISHYLIRVESL